MAGRASNTIMLRRPMSEPHRPAYHFLPPANWINDPNGLIFHKGLYHLFYQHNMNAPDWGDMVWGHATSSDLVHWKDHPIALNRDKPYDSYGCFSGSAFADGDRLYVLYTGVSDSGSQTQCLAHSDDGIHFSKHPDNPVIPAPPEEFGTADFRDPYVWREGKAWNMVVMAAAEDRRKQAVLLYEAQRPDDWHFARELYTHHGPCRSERLDFECPNYFQLGDKKALIHLHMLKRANFVRIGDEVDGEFQPEESEWLDYGHRFAAAQTFRASRDRLIAFGWLTDSRPLEMRLESGWAGCLSLPREIKCGPGCQLRYQPAEELNSLRKQAVSISDLELMPGLHMFEKIQGDQLELCVKIAPGSANRIGLMLRTASDFSENTKLIYDHSASTLTLDRGMASGNPQHECKLSQAPFAFAENELLELAVYIDHSIIEVFANNRTCITDTVFPARSDAVNYGLFIDGGQASLLDATAYQMNPVW